MHVPVYDIRGHALSGIYDVETHYNASLPNFIFVSLWLYKVRLLYISE